jgi:cell division protein FtsB
MKKPKKKRKWRILFAFALWLVIASVFTGAIAMQASRYNHYRRELNHALVELETEQKRHAELLEERVYYESDAYIEQLARDYWGYVKPDEIVFKNVAN